MIRIMLDNPTRDELRTIRRSDLPIKVRDRIEMIRLSEAYWSAPRIAVHFPYHPQTVRDMLRAFFGRVGGALCQFRGEPHFGWRACLTFGEICYRERATSDMIEGITTRAIAGH
jgi:hypothetical protein